MSKENRIVATFKRGKAKMFLIFVTLSFLFLILIKLSNTYTQTISFAIQVNNTPSNIKNNNSQNLQAINLTIETLGFNFLKYYLAEPKLNINFNDLKKEDSFYVWSAKTYRQHIISQLDHSYIIKDIKPEEVNFIFNELFQKTIPVILNSDIQYAIGYDTKEAIVLHPDAVHISGPKNLLDTLQNVYTNTLILNNVKDNIDNMIQIVNPFSNTDVVVSQKQIRVTAQVEKFTQGQFTLPIQIINIPDTLKINYYPKTINMSYYTSLSNFKNIKKEDFIISCDFMQTLNKSTVLIPQIIKQPKGVKNVRLDTKHIEYIVIK